MRSCSRISSAVHCRVPPRSQAPVSHLAVPWTRRVWALHPGRAVSPASQVTGAALDHGPGSRVASPPPLFLPAARTTPLTRSPRGAWDRMQRRPPRAIGSTPTEVSMSRSFRSVSWMPRNQLASVPSGTCSTARSASSSTGSRRAATSAAASFLTSLSSRRAAF
jgi:hypothetical protein